MTMLIISRSAAKAQGLKRYCTGKPCKRGHTEERFIDGGCVVCKLASNNRWAKLNREKLAPVRKAWRVANAAKLREANKAYKAIWYPKNRAEVLAKSKEYARANPEVARAATRKWQSKNPEKAKEYAARWHSDPINTARHHSKRRARKLQAEGAHTRADLTALLKAQRHRCTYCRADLRKVGRHLDHIMPLALGGSNGPENLQYLCPPCNLSKGAKDPLQFAKERELLL